MSEGEARAEGLAAVILRPMRPDDWPAVRAIFEEGIESGNATFETSAPAWDDWDASHLRVGRLVAVESGGVVGWVALAPTSRREVYRGVVELSVYVAAGARGRGAGRALVDAAIDASERAGVWTLHTGVFPENRASVALFRRCGFRVVGVFERVGLMGERWRDVLVLERRGAAAVAPR